MFMSSEKIIHFLKEVIFDFTKIHSDGGLLQITKPRMKHLIAGDKEFLAKGNLAWNEFPEETRLTQILTTFRKGCKTSPFDRSFPL